MWPSNFVFQLYTRFRSHSHIKQHAIQAPVFLSSVMSLVRHTVQFGLYPYPALHQLVDKLIHVSWMREHELRLQLLFMCLCLRMIHALTFKSDTWNINTFFILLHFVGVFALIQRRWWWCWMSGTMRHNCWWRRTPRRSKRWRDRTVRGIIVGLFGGQEEGGHTSIYGFIVYHLFVCALMFEYQWVFCLSFA